MGLFAELARDVATNGLFRPGADDAYADGDDSTWLDVDWPSLTRTVRVADGELQVVDTGGDKPPLLFIHGLAGLWQDWLLNIPAFMDTHRVVVPDLPGFGRSPMPAEKITINGYAKTVDALCGALGIDCPVVVGNSLGGFVAAELAIAFPTRVEKLVLVSAVGLSIEYTQREPLLALARAWAMAATRAGARSEAMIRRPRLRRAALQSVVRYPEKLSYPLTWELVQGAGKPGFMPAMEALTDYSFRDKLPQIEVPTLIVWGRNDMLVPVDDADEFKRLIGSNARREIFEDTGHVPMLERPSRFNELLREFIAGREAPEAAVEGVSGA
ncbi:MAG TPA: alpha/beta hydrolase [Solirubrobacteraceae bacterium]